MPHVERIGMLLFVFVEDRFVEMAVIGFVGKDVCGRTWDDQEANIAIIGDQNDRRRQQKAASELKRKHCRRLHRRQAAVQRYS